MSESGKDSEGKGGTEWGRVEEIAGVRTKEATNEGAAITQRGFILLGQLLLGRYYFIVLADWQNKIKAH